MNFAVIVFPGTSGEQAMCDAIANGIGEQVEVVPSTQTDLNAYDGIILPGGASFGNYLRPGALAKYTPVMEAVSLAANQGKLVLGVANGFQILLEAGLLPGAVGINQNLHFCCRPMQIVVENNQTIFTVDYQEKEVITLPVAIQEGRYYCDQATLTELQANRQIVFTYQDNIFDSTASIAGITNEQGNVLGMMPHPERAMDQLLGSADGCRLFTSILRSWRDKNGHA